MNPYTVTNKKGNMTTVTNENGLVAKNPSKFKKVNRPSICTSIDELEDEEEKISERKSLNQEKEPPSRIVQRPVRNKTCTEISSGLCAQSLIVFQGHNNPLF